MIRKLKALGAAMFALLALGAMASAAQASHLDFTTSSVGFLHGEQTNTHIFTLTDNNNVTVSCTQVTFANVEESSDKAETFTVHPEYSGTCVGFGGINVVVTTTGCNYEYHLGQDTGSPGFDGTVDVECGAGAITIAGGTCEVKFDTKQGYGAGAFTNTGGSGSAMDLLLHSSTTKMHYTVTKDGVACPLKAVGTFTEGDYTGTTTVKATDGTNAVGVTLTG